MVTVFTKEDKLGHYFEFYIMCICRNSVECKIVNIWPFSINTQIYYVVMQINIKTYNSIMTLTVAFAFIKYVVYDAITGALDLMTFLGILCNKSMRQLNFLKHVTNWTNLSWMDFLARFIEAVLWFSIDCTSFLLMHPDALSEWCFNSVIRMYVV